MGENQSRSRPPKLDDLIAVKDIRYGGAIRVDSYSQKAYQTLCIDEVSNESFR